MVLYPLQLLVGNFLAWLDGLGHWFLEFWGTIPTTIVVIVVRLGKSVGRWSWLYGVGWLAWRLCILTVAL